MQEFVPFLVVMACFAVIALLIVLYVRWQRRQASVWTVVAEGVLARTELRRRAFTSWSAMPMTPVFTTAVHHMTLVHLQDGRSFALDGVLQAPPEGTPVRLRRNGLGQHVLERLA